MVVTGFFAQCSTPTTPEINQLRGACANSKTFATFCTHEFLKHVPLMVRALLFEHRHTHMLRYLNAKIMWCEK